MAIRSSSGFSHLWPGVFHISLRTHKTQHTQLRGWKKREQPGLWVHKSKQSPFSDRQLPPTSADCSLLVTALFSSFDLRPYLPSSSFCLVGDLACKSFMCVSRQNRQRNLLTGTHPHPLKQMPNIVPHYPLPPIRMSQKFKLCDEEIWHPHTFAGLWEKEVRRTGNSRL